MAGETQTTQKEPAEGSRKVIDRELERQEKGENGNASGGGDNKKAMDDAAPQTEGRPGP
jgi:hypothetical protein